MAELERKWKGIEKADTTNVVTVITLLKQDLLTLGRLTEDQVSPWRQLRDNMYSVSYPMGDASGLGFRTVL